MESLKDRLAAHPFFDGIDPGHLAFLADWASEASYEVGEYILNEGDEADQFYLISQGEVSLGSYIPGQGLATIETLTAGEVVGWSWLVPPHHWHFSARVVKPAQVLVLDGARLREKCEEDHDFGYELFKRLALVVGQRLRATRMQLG